MLRLNPLVKANIRAIRLSKIDMEFFLIKNENILYCVCVYVVDVCVMYVYVVDVCVIYVYFF